MEEQADGTSWIKPTIVLCSYGFFKDMKPSEAFLTPYLNSTYQNISRKDISDEIYPVSTYSYLVFLFVVLMSTDFLRYKPLVVMEALAYMATRVILIWGRGIFIMQVMQVTYGLATATEIAYYSYIYALVEKEHFRRVTSYTRLTVLLGKGVGDLSGQLLYSTGTANLMQLNYVSAVSVGVALVVSLFLPKVSGSVFARGNRAFRRFSNDDERKKEDEPSSSVAPNSSNPNEETHDEPSEQVSKCPCFECGEAISRYLRKIWTTFKCSYSDKKLLQWSCFWALSMCGGLQTEDYVMNLWSALQSGGGSVYNGAVLAAGTLASALCVFLFSLCTFESNVFAEITIALLSIVQSIVVFVMAYTSHVVVAYVAYIVFRASYAFTLTVASYQIASRLNVDGYGLVFGWNTLVAVCLQSIITLIVVDKNGLDLPENKQFVVYGFYFSSLSLIFIARPIYRGLQKLLTCVTDASSSAI